MIRTTVKTTNFIARTSVAIQDAAKDGITAASRTAMTVAQASSSIDLQLQLLNVRSTGSGYAGGIVSRRKSDVRGSTAPIAAFFDKGTLGNRRGKLSPRTRRKDSWTDKRGHTYTRHEIKPGSGVPAERFFLKARRAGRQALIARIQRELA